MATTPIANFPNEDQGPTILATTLTVTSLALVTLIIRLFVRIRMIRNVGWDVSISKNQGLDRFTNMLQDYMMIVAMALVWNTTHYLF